MTTNLSTLSSADFQTELERRAEAERLAAKATLDHIHDAQHAWRLKILDVGEALENELEVQGRAHFTASAAAAKTGDLQTAYTEYLAFHAGHRARVRVRNEGMAAAAAEGVTFHAQSSVNWMPISFTEVLDKGLSEGADEGGVAIYENRIGDQPFDTDAANAYFTANV